MPATPIELRCFVIWFLWKPESFTCWYCRRYSVQKIGVPLLTATSPLLESLTSCCLMLWPNTSSGSFWRRENQSSMENMGSLLVGCCFCCFLTISWGSQQLSVTCVSQTVVPVSTYHHQTSVIYFYGFAHGMKLHWAVASGTHSGTQPFSALSLPQKELVWVLSGPCILLLLMKGLLSLASWPRGVSYCFLTFFLSHPSRDQFLQGSWGFILQMGQSAWLSPGSADQHTRFRRHAGGKLGLWGKLSS